MITLPIAWTSHNPKIKKKIKKQDAIQYDMRRIM
jgi:hypothetical protein